MDNFITPSDSLCETKIRAEIEMVKDEISRMCVTILDEYESGKIKNLPINERTLRRGVNGDSIDDKTVRTISCLFYKTEDFEKLIELVPVVLRTIIENANNKLSHQGDVPIEVATNQELVKLWNLCLGEGCSRSLGESYFGIKFDELINALLSYKLVIKSIFKENTWISCGEMITGRDELLFHYEVMHDFLKPSYEDRDLSKLVQYGSRMSKKSFDKLMVKMVDFFYNEIRNESLIELDDDIETVKFNFQMALVAIEKGKGDTNEVH
jgi:hypothetical protein